VATTVAVTRQTVRLHICLPWTYILTPMIIVDGDEAVRSASNNSSGDSSLFSSAMSFLGQNKVCAVTSRSHNIR
jgi:hypothetical protein